MYISLGRDEDGGFCISPWNDEGGACVYLPGTMSGVVCVYISPWNDQGVCVYPPGVVREGRVHIFLERSGCVCISLWGKKSILEGASIYPYKTKKGTQQTQKKYLIFDSCVRTSAYLYSRLPN